MLDDVNSQNISSELHINVPFCFEIQIVISSKQNEMYMLVAWDVGIRQCSSRASSRAIFWL